MSLQPFEEVVVRHGAMVLRTCRALVGHGDADDVWSEVFLSAMAAYPELRPDSNIGAWMSTIAHNKSIDHLRRRQRIRNREVPVTDGTIADHPGPGVAEPTIDEGLRSRLRNLPPKQRASVVHHYLGGLPHAEVGRILDISEAAARRNASDGVAKLRLAYMEESGR